MREQHCCARRCLQLSLNSQTCISHSPQFLPRQSLHVEHSFSSLSTTPIRTKGAPHTRKLSRGGQVRLEWRFHSHVGIVELKHANEAPHVVLAGHLEMGKGVGKEVRIGRGAVSVHLSEAGEIVGPLHKELGMCREWGGEETRSSNDQPNPTPSAALVTQSFKAFRGERVGNLRPCEGGIDGQ